MERKGKDVSALLTPEVQARMSSRGVTKVSDLPLAKKALAVKEARHLVRLERKGKTAEPSAELQKLMQEFGVAKVSDLPMVKQPFKKIAMELAQQEMRGEDISAKIPENIRARMAKRNVTKVSDLPMVKHIMEKQNLREKMEVLAVRELRGEDIASEIPPEMKSRMQRKGVSRLSDMPIVHGAVKGFETRELIIKLAARELHGENVNDEIPVFLKRWMRAQGIHHISQHFVAIRHFTMERIKLLQQLEQQNTDITCLISPSVRTLLARHRVTRVCDLPADLFAPTTQPTDLSVESRRRASRHRAPHRRHRGRWDRRTCTGGEGSGGEGSAPGKMQTEDRIPNEPLSTQVPVPTTTGPSCAADPAQAVQTYNEESDTDYVVEVMTDEGTEAIIEALELASIANQGNDEGQGEGEGDDAQAADSDSDSDLDSDGELIDAE
eukprot:TRINITY_DN1588_c0_g1::TRINITY_DN1588_c0_g1_i1::g.28295::m.28295 TRINITY_DN1588_c0_g1::TRINITY_DN1588_c0_g1_i1::g.28295  ORF type:complete len:475 (+),score=121.14,DUF1389/PF07146.6/46,DUF1389/PF07146.6/1.9,DUF1389/PF07146.6/5.4e+02,DUF1389/PF07146.6/5.8e+02,Med15_fungi/PF05397.7/4.8e+02,Med15_fungi/PF05397.7/6.8,Med15_fungi/PF05397.7/1.2e+02,Med15_fungi/PF05397.7/1.7e+03 TRINITY_DN1588_c0_g1_i1:113-1426(+)